MAPAPNTKIFIARLLCKLRGMRSAAPTSRCGGFRQCLDIEPRLKALHADGYAFQLRVLVHGLGPVLSADAAHLVSAEGNFGLIAVGVEEDVACLQLLRNPMTLSNVIQPNITGLSQLRIVVHAN